MSNSSKENNIEENKINIDDKINKHMKSNSEKVKSIFEKIDFLEMSPEQKASVAIQVKNDAI